MTKIIPYLSSPIIKAEQSDNQLPFNITGNATSQKLMKPGKKPEDGFFKFIPGISCIHNKHLHSDNGFTTNVLLM